tara:strand:+ start:5889 stop:6425 length:537 start_codon:yes stop_codon:yes gene_type:complete
MKLAQANTKKMLVLKVLLVVRVMLVQYSHVLVQAVENTFQLPVAKVLGIVPGLIHKQVIVRTIVRTVTHKQIAQPVRQQQLVVIGHVHSVSLVNILQMEQPVPIVLITPTLLPEHLRVRLIPHVVTKPMVPQDLQVNQLQQQVRALTVRQAHTLLQVQQTVLPAHLQQTRNMYLARVL